MYISVRCWGIFFAKNAYFLDSEICNFFGWRKKTSPPYLAVGYFSRHPKLKKWALRAGPPTLYTNNTQYNYFKCITVFCYGHFLDIPISHWPLIFCVEQGISPSQQKKSHQLTCEKSCIKTRLERLALLLLPQKISKLS